MIRVGLEATGLFERRMREIQSAMQTNSRQAVTMRQDLKRIAEQDYRHTVLSDIDRFGRERAPLAESTLRNKNRGPDPRSLIPHGEASRFLRNATWTWILQDHVNVLVGALWNIVDKKGRSFAQYHLTGGPRLPRRDVGGIGPDGRRSITQRFIRFRDEIAGAGRF